MPRLLLTSAIPSDSRNTFVRPPLNLENLGAKPVRICLTIFYLCIIGYLIESGFTVYAYQWSCQTLCGQKISTNPRELNIASIDTTCMSAGPTLEFPNSTTIWQGVGINLNRLNRFFRAQIIAENPLPNSDSDFAIEFLYTYEFMQPHQTTRISERGLIQCEVGHDKCEGYLFARTDNLPSGVYSITYLAYETPRVIYTDDYNNQTLNAPISSVPMTCQNNRWVTILSLLVRYLCLLLLLLFLGRLIYVTDWKAFSWFFTEQYWVLLLAFTLILYYNVFFAYVVFGSDQSSGFYKFCQLLEFNIRYWYRYFGMAFEIIVVSASRGVINYLFRYIYIPSIWASLWLAGVLSTLIIHAAVHPEGSSWHFVDVWNLQYSSTFDVILSWTRYLLILIWYCWIVNLALSAHKELRRLPYLRTRYRQLSLRVFLDFMLLNDVAFLANIIYFAVTTPWRYSAILTPADNPSNGLAESFKALVFTVALVFMFMPISSRDQSQQPPIPEDRWWTKIRWPDAWSNWLDRHGAAFYYFLWEEEKRTFNEAQTRDLDETADLTTTYLANTPLPILEHVKTKLVEMRDSFRSHLPPVPGVSSLADPPVRHFFCLETALIHWNMSWEVYFPEPPELNPGRAQSVAVEVAEHEELLPRFAHNSYNSRLQYLRNAYHATGEDWLKGNFKHCPAESATNRGQGLGTTSEEEVMVRIDSSRLLMASLQRASPVRPYQSQSFGHQVMGRAPSGGLFGANRQRSPFSVYPSGRRPSGASQLEQAAPTPESPTALTPHTPVDYVWPDPDAATPNVNSVDMTYMDLSPQREIELSDQSLIWATDLDSQINSLLADYTMDYVDDQAPGAYLPYTSLVSRIRCQDFLPEPEALPLPSVPQKRVAFGESDLADQESISSVDVSIANIADNVERDSMDPEELTISKLEALIEEKKMKKKKRMITLDHMSIERYGYKLLTVVNRKSNQSLVAVNSDRIIVSIRGTYCPNNWKDNFRGYPRVVEEMLGDRHLIINDYRTCCIFDVPKCHAGWYDCWRSLRGETLEAIHKAVEAHPDHQIHVTGHSMGGAQAYLCAYELQKAYPEKEVVCYTFGGPKAGNTAFQTIYNKFVPHTFRVCMDQDVVPNVPPKINPLGIRYVHVGKEVRIDLKGNIIIEPSILEKTFRTGNKAKALLHHTLEGYRKGLEAICKYNDMTLSEEVAPFGSLLDV